VASDAQRALRFLHKAAWQKSITCLALSALELACLGDTLQQPPAYKSRYVDCTTRRQRAASRVLRDHALLPGNALMLLYASLYKQLSESDGRTSTDCCCCSNGLYGKLPACTFLAPAVYLSNHPCEASLSGGMCVPLWPYIVGSSDTSKADLPKVHTIAKDIRLSAVILSTQYPGPLASNLAYRPRDLTNIFLLSCRLNSMSMTLREHRLRKEHVTRSLWELPESSAKSYD
jgi:hypothetical protein